MASSKTLQTALLNDMKVTGKGLELLCQSLLASAEFTRLNVPRPTIARPRQQFVYYPGGAPIYVLNGGVVVMSLLFGWLLYANFRVFVFQAIGRVLNF